MESNPLYHHLKVHIEPISPIHIGTNTTYEPHQFVIDAKRKKLYYLPEREVVENVSPFLFNSSDSYLPWRIHRELQRKVDQLKSKAQIEVEIDDSFLKEYKKTLKNLTNPSRRNTPVSWKINQIYRIPRKLRKGILTPYIPGSSFKGALFTALGEYWSKKIEKGEIPERAIKELPSLFHLTPPKESASPSDQINKCLLVGDSIFLKKYQIEAKIGLVGSFHRFDESTKFNHKVYRELWSGGKMVIHLGIKKKGVCRKEGGEFLLHQFLNQKEFIHALNSHYLPILKQMLEGGEVEVIFYRKNQNGREEEEVWIYDDYTPDKLTDEFKRRAKKFIEKIENDDSKAPKYALIRLGHHSHARAVTIEGKRRIKVKHFDGEKEPILNQETTFAGVKVEGENEKITPLGWAFLTFK
jgi:hypothetical protein